MNLEVDDQLKEFLVWQSFKNPLLVQEYCLRLCLRHDATERQTNKRKLNVDTSILKEMLTNAGKDIGKHFSGLITKVGDRNVSTKFGKNISIHKALILSIAKCRILDPLSTITVARRIRKLLSPSERITKEQVHEIILETVERLSGGRSKDYALSYTNGYLFILHPYFKLFLLWDYMPNVTGEYLPIDEYLKDSEDENSLVE